MVSPSAQPASRYRRRILALGALATGALYVIGAPIFADRIESDLETRVPEELAAAGFTGVTASFSGQDGTLTCEAPLSDPEAARAAAYDVHGVRAIELDRSCRVNTTLTDDASTGDTVGDGSEDANDESSDGSDGSAESADDADSPTTTSSTPETSTSDPALATVRDVVAANADLAFLSVLLTDTDIGRSDRPITLFAPDNAAFDAVPSDVLGRLQNDPELLERVLEHHAVDGAVATADLESGELTADDGGPLTVVVGDTITIGGATIIEPDVVASNGVVHVIDAVLVPEELLEEPQAARSPVTVSYDGERMVVSGVVASEVERQSLLGSTADAVGADLVVDETTVDPDTGVGAEAAAVIGELVRAVPDNLLSAEVGFDGTALYASGVARTDDGAAAFVVVATEVDVEPALSDPPEATEDDAASLEEQLNQFVAENPILFEPSSDVLLPSAFEVIDRVAADALAFDGIAITVEGHTDSDGVAIENLQLSQNRAEAVRDALIERGLDPASVESIGLGSDQPVLVDGEEDKAASRRVEFRVVVTS